jgi:hypothetical protein
MHQKYYFPLHPIVTIDYVTNNYNCMVNSSVALPPNTSLGELWWPPRCTKPYRSQTVSCIITSSQFTKIIFSPASYSHNIDYVSNIYDCMVNSSVAVSPNTSLGEQCWPPGCTKSNRNKTEACIITSSQSTKIIFFPASYNHDRLCHQYLSLHGQQFSCLVPQHHLVG